MREPYRRMKESYRRFKWDVFPAYEWKDWLDKKTGKPLVWPPGDSAGFESPAAVEKAWQQYGEKKKVGLVLGKVLGSGSPRTYSPMSSEHATLFKTFADLDYMDREAILGFATNFGFLGLDPQQQDVFPGPSGDAHIVSGESHLSWAREICLMREAIHLSRDRTPSEDLKYRTGWNQVGLSPPDEEDRNKRAWLFNSRLQHTQVRIEWEDDTGPRLSFTPQNLLSSLWLQLALFLVGDVSPQGSWTVV